MSKKHRNAGVSIMETTRLLGGGHDEPKRREVGRPRPVERGDRLRTVLGAMRPHVVVLGSDDGTDSVDLLVVADEIAIRASASFSRQDAAVRVTVRLGQPDDCRPEGILRLMSRPTSRCVRLSCDNDDRVVWLFAETVWATADPATIKLLISYVRQYLNSADIAEAFHFAEGSHAAQRHVTEVFA